MQLEYAKTPVWANAEHTMIDLAVKWVEFDKELPFTASPNDCEDHGRAIFFAAQSGKYGEVAEFAPYVPTPEEKAAAICERRNALLVASDWTQIPDVPEPIQAAWKPYRQALRDITQQPTFPQSVTWPEAP